MPRLPVHAPRSGIASMSPRGVTRLRAGAVRLSVRDPIREIMAEVTHQSLPARPGERPRTTPTNPHTQLDQQPLDAAVVEELARRIFALPGVVERPSGISVPG